VEYRYLDVIWLDNLFLNYILNWITRKLSGNASPMWRLWCSAGVGAVYAVFMILPGFSILSRFPLKVLLSLVMLAIGFRISGFRDFMKLFGLFYGATFLLGGTAFGIYYFCNVGITVTNGVFFIRDFPLTIVLFSVVCVIMLYRLLWPLLRLRMNRRQLIYPVEVGFDGESVGIDAYLDTGNELADPISGIPVMVVEFEQIQALLPPEIQKIFQEGREENLEYITRVMADSTWISRFRMVPYHTLGHSESLLLAFRPDRARIQVDGTWTEIGEVLIGIRNQRLSGSEEYHALIQPQIIP